MATETNEACDLVSRLRTIVGRRHVLQGARAASFARGFRFGAGEVESVVEPGTLVEMWRAAKACVDAGRILIIQAANTGLTGGSTPNGVYDRPVVLINTQRLHGIFPVRGGQQVVCLAGTTLYDLEKRLRPLGREPHSVIGSSCIGASVVGGVCNNSGGALVRRGPAYTEYALFARVGTDGILKLHNRLGVDLGEDAETVLANLEAGRFGDDDVINDDKSASAARDYSGIVRDIDASTPARFNADPSRLFEVSGSAGRLIVFAVRLDTFERANQTRIFYVGTDNADELTALRRRLLSDSPALPVSGEYIHREAFDYADRYGKDMVVAIRALGTNRLPALFRAKAWIDRLSARLPFLPSALSDRLMQTASHLFPDHLPARMRDFRHRFEHHLILNVGDDAISFTRKVLSDAFPSASGDMFECSALEAECAMLHRFAVAGAAVRYRAVHRSEVEDIVALDIALPRNERQWVEKLPPEIEEKLIGKLYYGHFFCHVFHQDYLVKKGEDAVALEHQLLALMDTRGAEYPAEHNVGHLYPAKPALAAHYRSLDPTNTLNPGLGGTSRARDWL